MGVCDSRERTEGVMGVCEAVYDGSGESWDWLDRVEICDWRSSPDGINRAPDGGNGGCWLRFIGVMTRISNCPMYPLSAKIAQLSYSISDSSNCLSVTVFFKYSLYLCCPLRNRTTSWIAPGTTSNHLVACGLWLSSSDLWVAHEVACATWRKAYGSINIKIKTKKSLSRLFFEEYNLLDFICVYHVMYNVFLFDSDLF